MRSMSFAFEICATKLMTLFSQTRPASAAKSVEIECGAEFNLTAGLIK